MKKSKILILLSLFILISGCSISGKVSYLNEYTPEEVKAETLSDTIITPYLGEKISESKNVVFCSTFQMAWTELKDNIIKSDIHLRNEPPLVEFLNLGKPSKKDISNKDYVAMAGFKKDNIVDKINAELLGKFNEDAPVLDANTLTNPDDILAYSYLNKNIKFKQVFESLEKPIKFFYESKVDVKGFGIKKYSNNSKHKELRKQVDIYDYKYVEDEKRNNFIVKLNSESEKDEIVIALIKPKVNITETINYVSNIILEKSPSKMNEGDSLAIPVINFNVLKSYNELKQKKLLNHGFEDYIISKALQSIRFKLDEKGAILKVEAKIEVQKEEILETTKNMNFNQPFLIYLKERNSDYPYLAMWVNNTELLTKVK